MTSITRASFVPARAVPSSGGYSREARFIFAQRTEKRKERLKDAFEELWRIAEECKHSDWDHCGAECVADSAFKTAFFVLEALPEDVPVPSIGVEPDGHMTLEWYKALNRTISISISPEGLLHYAAMIGNDKAFGTESFFGELPATILALIHRVNS